jgi:hypothetical protein
MTRKPSPRAKCEVLKYCQVETGPRGECPALVQCEHEGIIQVQLGLRKRGWKDGEKVRVTVERLGA